MDASCNAKPAVVAVVGSTATGKTALGVALAQQFSGEVISADSMQIYKGLDVGTAKAFRCRDRKTLELLHPQDGIGHDKNDGQEHIDKLFIGQLNP